MSSYKVYYAGKSKAALKLEESSEYLVVRLNKAGTLAQLPLNETIRRSIQPLQTVAGDLDAGVEILRCNAPRQTVRKIRNKIRMELKKQKGIRFSGKVLQEKTSGEPFLYTENIFVQFKPSISDAACKKTLRSLQLKVKSKLTYATRAFFVEAKEGTGIKVFAIASNLLKRPDVLLCHPELVRALDKKVAFPQQWHLAKKRINGQLVDQHANVEACWNLSKGENTIIAIIDDGVDAFHQEFAGSRKITSPRDVARGINSSAPGDGDNHGTACAGVACANGVDGASGVAPQARLMPIRSRAMLGSQSEADAFIWASDHGADVISCSWGPRDGRWWDSSDPMHNNVEPLPDSTRLAIDYAISNGRNGKGCVITWAAGNGNESVDNDGYASYEKVIAVAACNDMGTRSAYSDKGQALWCAFPSNHGDVSLTEGVWTTDRSGTSGYNFGNTDSGDANGDYTNSFGGTSSSCPGVAGVAALIISRNPDLRWDQVKDIIKRSCDKIDAANGNYNASKHSSLYGYGRVNALEAVKLASPAQAKYSVIHHARQDVPIKDNKTCSLKLAIGDKNNLKNIIVGIDIEHTYIGDLLIDLLAPVGSGLPTIRLHNKEGRGSDNLNREYDVASTPALQQLIGNSLEGQWTLRIKDTANADTGKIKSFYLNLEF